MKRSVTVTEAESSSRLDVFLSRLFPEISRERIKQAITRGDVSLNGRVEKRPSLRVKAGQKIDAQVTLPDTELRASTVPLNIVFEDGDFLIIDKPAGLVVHPGAGISEGTLANALIAKYPEMKNFGPKFRPGIVHRLDKDTSGLLLVAKNEHAYDYAKALFQNREIEKWYIALVHGIVRQKHGLINKPLQLKPERKRVVVSEEGRPALTEYTVVKYYQSSRFDGLSRGEKEGHSEGVDPHTNPAERSKAGSFSGLNSNDSLGNLKRVKGATLGEGVDYYSQILVKLHTGRTHQIRVHFADAGHPIAGDSLYGKGKPVPRGLTRQFLHANRLVFKQPSGTVVDIESPLPDDLQHVLNNFKEV